MRLDARIPNELRMLSDKYNLMRKDFQHVVLEGTAYEVGQRQAEILKKQNPSGELFVRIICPQV